MERGGSYGGEDDTRRRETEKSGRDARTPWGEYSVSEFSGSAGVSPAVFYPRSRLPSPLGGRGIPQCVTFRLADSLPFELFERWAEELEHCTQEAVTPSAAASKPPSTPAIAPVICADPRSPELSKMPSSTSTDLYIILINIFISHIKYMFCLRRFMTKVSAPSFIPGNRSLPSRPIESWAPPAHSGRRSTSIA